MPLLNLNHDEPVVTIEHVWTNRGHENAGLAPDQLEAILLLPIVGTDRTHKLGAIHLPAKTKKEFKAQEVVARARLAALLTKSRKRQETTHVVSVPDLASPAAIEHVGRAIANMASMAVVLEDTLTIPEAKAMANLISRKTL